jgi:hypothetical protein
MSEMKCPSCYNDGVTEIGITKWNNVYKCTATLCRVLQYGTLYKDSEDKTYINKSIAIWESHYFAPQVERSYIVNGNPTRIINPEENCDHCGEITMALEGGVTRTAYKVCINRKCKQFRTPSEIDDLEYIKGIKFGKDWYPRLNAYKVVGCKRCENHAKLISVTNVNSRGTPNNHSKLKYRCTTLLCKHIFELNIEEAEEYIKGERINLEFGLNHHSIPIDQHEAIMIKNDGTRYIKRANTAEEDAVNILTDNIIQRNIQTDVDIMKDQINQLLRDVEELKRNPQSSNELIKKIRNFKL